MKTFLYRDRERIVRRVLNDNILKTVNARKAVQPNSQRKGVNFKIITINIQHKQKGVRHDDNKNQLS